MRQFTPEEAAALLPRVRELAETMVELRSKLRSSHGASEGWGRAVSSNGGGRRPPGLVEEERERAAVAAEFQATLNAIEELGVLVKDVDTGLLDFPARHPVTGESVLLCWKLGENEIGFWHGEDEGFAGRKSLPFS